MRMASPRLRLLAGGAELIRQIDNDNLETEVILAREKVAKLNDLLPYHCWRSKARV
jgi:hypothetical protein